MQFPNKCPECEKSLVEHPPEGGYFLERGKPDFDKDTPDRIVDSIEECSECHTLFRFRWKLISIHKLVEQEI